jgi:hypothetical protein
MIERETFDWGVRLTARPFEGGEHPGLTIQADIGPYKHNRGSDVCITFTGVPAATSLRLGDAQIWYEAMHALVNETRIVIGQMKAASQMKKSAKKRQ